MHENFVIKSYNDYLFDLWKQNTFCTRFHLNLTKNINGQVYEARKIVNKRL